MVGVAEIRKGMLRGLIREGALESLGLWLREVHEEWDLVHWKAGLRLIELIVMGIAVELVS